MIILGSKKRSKKRSKKGSKRGHLGARKNKFIKRDSIGKNQIAGRLYTARFHDNIFETDLEVW